MDFDSLKELKEEEVKNLYDDYCSSMDDNKLEYRYCSYNYFRKKEPDIFIGAAGHDTKLQPNMFFAQNT